MKYHGFEGSHADFCILTFADATRMRVPLEIEGLVEFRHGSELIVRGTLTCVITIGKILRQCSSSVGVTRDRARWGRGSYWTHTDR